MNRHVNRVNSDRLTFFHDSPRDSLPDLPLTSLPAPQSGLERSRARRLMKLWMAHTRRRKRSSQKRKGKLKQLRLPSTRPHLALLLTSTFRDLDAKFGSFTPSFAASDAASSADSDPGLSDSDSSFTSDSDSLASSLTGSTSDSSFFLDIEDDPPELLPTGEDDEDSDWDSEEDDDMVFGGSGYLGDESDDEGDEEDEGVLFVNLFCSFLIAIYPPRIEQTPFTYKMEAIAPLGLGGDQQHVQ